MQNDKVNGFIRVYDGTIYLVISGPEKYDAIYNRTRYLTSQKMVLHMLFLIIMHCMWNGCHDVLTMSMNLNNIAILNINGLDYRGINKVVNLLAKQRFE